MVMQFSLSYSTDACRSPIGKRTPDQYEKTATGNSGRHVIFQSVNANRTLCNILSLYKSPGALHS